MEKQPLPRATIEVISVLIFQGIISVYSMTWWLKLIIMSILGIGAIIVVNRIPKTISLSLKHKVIISILTIVVWIPISWYPIQEQWNKDHPQIQRPVSLPPVVSKIPNIKKIPVVYKPFRSAYEIHKTKLGNPIEGAKLTQQAYEAAHEHATVIWSNSLSRVYRLRGDNSFSSFAQPTFNQDPKWVSNEWLTNHFHPTNGLAPPYSWVAVLWDADEKNWSWIGFRIWHCYFYSIHYQKFEHGIIIGSFSKLPETKNKDYNELFILLDDSRWDSQQSETLPTGKREQPPDEVKNVQDYQSEPASTATRWKK